MIDVYCHARLYCNSSCVPTFLNSDLSERKATLFCSVPVHGQTSVSNDSLSTTLTVSMPLLLVGFIEVWFISVINCIMSEFWQMCPVVYLSPQTKLRYFPDTPWQMSCLPFWVLGNIHSFLSLNSFLIKNSYKLIHTICIPLCVFFN